MSDSPPVTQWPKPLLRPVKQSPRRVLRIRSDVTVGAVGRRFMESLAISRYVFMFAGPAPVPFILGAGTLTRVYEYRVDEADRARKEREYTEAIKQWEEKQFEPCVKHVKDRAGLIEARTDLRSGRMTRSSEIIIAPPYGEKILSVFKEAKKFLVQEEVEHFELAEEVAGLAISAAFLLGLGLPLPAIYAVVSTKGMKGLTELATQTFKGAKVKAGSALDGMTEKDHRHYGEKVAKYVITKSRNKIRHTAEFDTFLAMESAWIVWEFACNGMKPITTADGYVLLRWGERTKDDFK